MDVEELRTKWTGWSFDEIDFEIDSKRLVEFAESCGEKLKRYTDPEHPDFQAAPSYTASFHGRRQLPEGFPMKRETSFDGGKCVEWKAPIRPGDRIVARSHIHDIFSKTGRSGSMMFVVHRMEFTNQDEILVAIVDWKMIQQLG
jgi:hypothetical protein